MALKKAKPWEINSKQKNDTFLLYVPDIIITITIYEKMLLTMIVIGFYSSSPKIFNIILPWE